MNASTRIIVAEQVMPSRTFNSSSSSSMAKQKQISDDTSESESFASAEQESIMRALDMQMMVQFRSQERTREE